MAATGLAATARSGYVQQVYRLDGVRLDNAPEGGHVRLDDIVASGQNVLTIRRSLP